MNGGGEGKEIDEREVVEGNKKGVLMWGYLPGMSPQRSPILYPTAVSMPDSGDGWMEVCGGGCGFAMALSESGKVFTWGSIDDLGISHVASGKHEETPGAFPVPTEVPIVKAAAGWAHCVAVTGQLMAMCTHGVGKSVFRQEGLLENILQEQARRRKKCK